jgi:hypothetical protein
MRKMHADSLADLVRMAEKLRTSSEKIRYPAGRDKTPSCLPVKMVRHRNDVFTSVVPFFGDCRQLLF